MSTIDVESLLQAVSPEAPCGEDLEYDPGFGEMEQAAQGKPEQQYGDTIIPAEGPDWRKVRRRALDLLARSHDLRAAAYLTRALLYTDGLPGLRDGLALLRGLVERYWETLHPQLDPDDDFDPTQRVNILLALCDPQSTLPGLRDVPLISPRALGRFSLRDVQLATGRLAPAEGEAVPDLSAIEAAFAGCEPQELTATLAAVQEAIDHVKAIEALVTERVGAEQAPNMEDLAKMLHEMGQILAEHVQRRGLSAGAEVGAVTMAEEVSPQAGTGSGPAPALSGAINSREEVVRTIDRLCEYYRRNEPSSPVPLLLQRARRLVSKDFMEILSELAPEGLSQAQTVFGAGGEESSSEESAE